jgi:sulfur dioxygenase
MIFRQLWDLESSTYTYLIAGGVGGEALIIDPVRSRVPQYLRLLKELNLVLKIAIDTHLHADHVTGTGPLAVETGCVVMMGIQSAIDWSDVSRFQDGDTLAIEGISLQVLYTPGHTDDSYCFYMGDRVFTGDTLFIRGTGRTDFQNGSASMQYDSLFKQLFSLPEETLVYPGHDYQGMTVSTIREERLYNPRVQVASRDDYVTLMNGLNLPYPKLMGVAVPENRRCGLDQSYAL